jgi:hypothetical protein
MWHNAALGGSNNDFWLDYGHKSSRFAWAKANNDWYLSK